VCQNGSLSVISSMGETEKTYWGPSQASRVGAAHSHVAFDKKFRDENGSERRYSVVMQQPVLLSPEFEVKS
jgi:hypothetical protein